MIAHRIAHGRAVRRLGVTAAVLLVAVPAAIASPVYTVAKLDVDVTAADAVTAKEQALAAAQRRALRIMLKRIAPFGAEERLPRVEPQTVEAMLVGFSVRDEAISGTRYIATLDFEFQPGAVRQLLGGYGLNFDDRQAPPTQVLPVLIADGQARIDPGEPWRQAWAGLDLANALTPVQLVQPGTALETERLEAAMAGDGRAFRTLQGELQADRLVLAVAEARDGRLVTRLLGRDNAGYIDLSRSDRIHDTPRSAAARAATVALRVMESRWKITDSAAGADVEAAAPSDMLLRVEFSGLREWQEIRSRLVQVAGVQGLEVGSLSARSAEIRFRFAGDTQRLSRQLADHDLALHSQGGAWVLRAH